MFLQKGRIRNSGPVLSNHYGGQGLEGQRHQVADGSEGGRQRSEVVTLN